MLLKFHARPGHHVYYPERRRSGQLYHYIGRRFVPSDDGRTAGNHVPTDEPFVIDDDHVDADTRRAALRLKRMCREGSILPADADTARACNVPFVALEKGDDGWVPRAKRIRSATAEKD